MYFVLVFFSVLPFLYQIDYPSADEPIIAGPANAQWVVIHRAFEIALGYHVCPAVFRIITLRPIKNNPPPRRSERVYNARAVLI